MPYPTPPFEGLIPLKAGAIEPSEVWTPTVEYLLSLETFRAKLITDYQVPSPHKMRDSELAEFIRVAHSKISGAGDALPTAFDSVDAEAIPSNASYACGYVDGNYTWSTAEWDRFTGYRVGIDVWGNGNYGTVYDCETGNGVPGDAPGWAAARRAQGVDPTVYCGQNTWWQQIIEAFEAAGIAQPHYWIANYNYSLTIPVGAIAHQYEDAGGYDLSVVVLSGWPGVVPSTPTPPPAPPPPPVYYEGDLNGMGLVAMCWRPGGNGSVASPSGYRTDYAYIQPETGNLLHGWNSNGTAGQWAQQSLGGQLDPRFGVSMAWSHDGAFLVFAGVGVTGNIYIYQEALDGSGGPWDEIECGNQPLTPAEPPATPGPEGPAGKDGAGITPAVVSDFGAASTALAQLAKDLAAALGS